MVGFYGITMFEGIFSQKIGNLLGKKKVGEKIVNDTFMAAVL